MLYEEKCLEVKLKIILWILLRFWYKLHYLISNLQKINSPLSPLFWFSSINVRQVFLVLIKQKFPIAIRGKIMRISAVFTSFNYQMQGCQDNRIHITIYTVHLKNGTTSTLKPRCNVYCQYITLIIWFINLIKMRCFGDFFLIFY